MRRREFIAGLGGVAAWRLAGRAEPKMPVVGVLSGTGPNWPQDTRKAFVLGLSEAGYSEGKNVVLEYRWAGGRYDELLPLAVDLVREKVSVIFANGNA